MYISMPDDLNLSEITSRVSVVETDFWLFIDKLNPLHEKKKLDQQIVITDNFYQHQNHQSIQS